MSQDTMREDPTGGCRALALLALVTVIVAIAAIVIIRR